ncbi:NADP-dependent oxidoreductase [Patulibacter defluvii]|uniref:NADP-dependent oxidoreductase n=1 Tax=Patulibacter defluvii TaxID=3095358 RepID=UPI002A7662B6|nr:NADP-dependent oxidoreductase [Patulibacter sp. DM4]
MPHVSREIRLAARPHGAPTLDTFAHAEVELPDPGPGQVVVRNRWISVDPYMRGRMSDAPSYTAPYEVGEAMLGGAVGEVIASGDERFPTGTTVLHGLGWRDVALVEGDHVVRVDPDVAPIQAYLGILGMPGLTAYGGLVETAGIREGDTVFVSAAAGAVGSAVGQIARQLGASRVIGSAGGPEKVRHVVDDLGFDGAIDYREGRLRRQLRELAPDGIDVYFDNVGGEHLEVAIGALRLHGRIAICGMISQYNATEPAPGPRNLVRLIQTRGSIRGLLVYDFEHLRERFVRDVGGWLAAGRLHYRETVVDGLDQAPQAFLDLLDGRNVGKMLVRLDG